MELMREYMKIKKEREEEQLQRELEKMEEIKKREQDAVSFRRFCFLCLFVLFHFVSLILYWCDKLSCVSFYAKRGTIKLEKFFARNRGVQWKLSKHKGHNQAKKKIVALRVQRKDTIESYLK